jgi:hypothetical protein
MIRRMFWLVVGAVLGVAGYRRVSRLARTVIPGRRGAAQAGEAPGSRTGGRLHSGWAQRAALFARDVRDGMELYSDHHPGLTGRTLEIQRARARRLEKARPGEDDHDHGRACHRVDYAKEVR